MMSCQMISFDFNETTIFNAFFEMDFEKITLLKTIIVASDEDEALHISHLGNIRNSERRIMGSNVS